MLTFRISRCVKQKSGFVYAVSLKSRSSSLFHQDDKIFASGLFVCVCVCVFCFVVVVA